jgi:hypothetical protein
LIERVARYVINGNKKRKEGGIDIEYIDQVLKTLIEKSLDTRLSNRIRFRIYDFRDLYEKEWKVNIQKQKLLMKGE